MDNYQASACIYAICQEQFKQDVEDLEVGIYRIPAYKESAVYSRLYDGDEEEFFTLEAKHDGSLPIHKRTYIVIKRYTRNGNVVVYTSPDKYFAV